MRINGRWIGVAVPLLLFAGTPVQEAPVSIVPWPAEVQPRDGAFTLDANTRVVVSDPSVEELRRLAALLTRPIREATGLRLELVTIDGPVPPNTIVLGLRHDDGNEDADADGARERDAGRSPGAPYERDETYQLRIDGDRILLLASSTAGIFYGIQTLRQLLPPAATRIAGSGSGRNWLAGEETPLWTVPALEIRDAPRFRYRGMHLDVGRHFFPVPFIKRYIDLLAMYKLNTLHWHLTEDQGWRIEIEKYPQLTEVASCRAETVVGKNFDPFVGDGTPYCGFYTQDEIRDIVAYAAERFVNVVPEIEMPGHSLAALAAYPELACTEGPFEVGTRWGVFEDIYCPTEETFTFLEDVLTEVMALFPSPYIHIGGDEAPKTRWEESPEAQAVIEREGLADEHELQSYFIRRIEVFLNASGRRLIGWDEILEGGLAPQATVMSWRGTIGGIEAAKEGHDVIMTPYSHVYFDYYQGDRRFEPLAIGGFTPLEKVYSFEPVPDELSEEEAVYILGGQANVWTEYIPTAPQVEYMALPRMLALAEVVWSPADARDWDAFVGRLPSQLERLEVLGVNYRIPEVAGLEEDRVTLDPNIAVALSHPLPEGEIRFTLDGSEPTRDSRLYSNPFIITFDPPAEERAPHNVATVSARAFTPGGRAGPISRARFSRVELTAAEAIDPGWLESGLDYRYYELGFESARGVLRAGVIRPRTLEVLDGPDARLLPDAIPPTRVTVATGFGLDGSERESDFGAVFEGYLRAPADGIYTFYVSSDDGAVLVIGDRVVVDHDGFHGMTEKSGSIALAAGLHPIALGFFQAGGAVGLEISVRLGGSERSELPADWLFRRE